ncbi:MAG: hypothetical protein LBC98_10920 [Prevotellaceae bacterium]|nr:hypothetical protein [Prevotellaceae bacterium]
MNTFTFGRYLLSLLKWIFLPACAGFILFEYLVPQYAFASYPLVPAATIIAGLLFFPVLKKAQTAGELRKSQLYLVGVGIKMIFSLAVVLIVTLNDKNNALKFAATYFVFYVILTIFANLRFKAK